MAVAGGLMPEMAYHRLTKMQSGPIAAAMTNAATISIVRRRRTNAVRADFCV
jgi:hypothetical protein